LIQNWPFTIRIKTLATQQMPSLRGIGPIDHTVGNKKNA
jgi:hypothetical protein